MNLFRICAVVGCLSGLLRATEPLELGGRREIFSDRFLIERLEGAALRLATPRREEAVVRFDAPWELGVNYATVLKDGDLYRLYYRGRLPAAADARAIGEEVTCYAESRDGVHWTKPNLGVVRCGERETNIMLGPDPVRRITHNFAPYLDPRPDVPVAERFKAVGGVFNDNGGSKTDAAEARVSGGLYRYVSADGIHWRLFAPEPIFVGYALDTLNALCWVESERRYAIYLRTWSEGGTPEQPQYRGVRTISRATSSDFAHWDRPVRMSFGDAPLEHLYTNGTHPYFRAPQLLVALPFRFWPDRQAFSPEQQIAWGVDPSQAHGVADAVFMTSRGGTTYDRTFLQSFIRPGLDALAWHARDNSPALGVVPTGPAEMSFYAVTHYTLPDCFLQRYTLRVDGFASVHADYSEGEMVTKPLRFTGRELVLNFSTSAAGSLHVDVLDAAGQVLAHGALMVGDAIGRPVTWNEPAGLSELAGRVVRLRFRLKDADLYSLQFRS